MTPSTQASLTFTGATLGDVAAQVTAYAEKISTGKSAGAAKTGKVAGTKGRAAPEPELGEAETSLADATGDEEGEGLLGDSSEDGETIGGEEATSFDDIADEPANGKKTAPKGKAPKVTLKDVNAALMNFMKITKKKKSEVQDLLKAKFKVDSVNDLKEVDYAKVIAACTPKAK